jgi:hypothetical protein
MSKMTKVLLTLSLSCLASGLVFLTGLVNAGEAVWLYVTFPAGAILFGLFLISMSLQGASALFDEEQRTIVAAVAKVHPTAGAPTSCCQPEQKDAYALVH